MSSDKRNQAVNWTDGMKLNKDHFIDQENWVQEGIKDSASIRLTNFNYGLLKGSTDSSLELMLNIDQDNQLNIKVTDCIAITRGGRRIEFDIQNIQKLQYPLEKLTTDFNISEASNEMFDIILAVLPDSRIPVGIPNDNEIPFRHPFVLPEYQIHVIPTKQVNASQMWNNHITIGKFQVVAREVQFYTDYIPPCSSVDAYPFLLDFYYSFENSIEKISSALAEYMRKNRNNEGKLDSNLCYVFERLAYFLTTNQSHYKLILRSESPVFMVEFFIRFARLYKSVLSWMSEYDREEILNHFSHFVSSRDIDDAAYELMNLEYDHQDIFSSVTKVDKFVSLVQDLFQKMVFSGKQIPPVKETPSPKKAKRGPVVIRDGKKIN